MTEYVPRGRGRARAAARRARHAQRTPLPPRVTEEDRLEREYAADPDSPVYTGVFDDLDEAYAGEDAFERDPRNRGEIGPAT